ncbi:CueP family metal-binding protein [Paenibacillus sp. sgz5001063]|uniref:CueP family metal-binding protein n=1 Tax=Paenibacillus sp. sgz5001063 TaxID=3242474 RepID=UPI0036D28F66
MRKKFLVAAGIVAVIAIGTYTLAESTDKNESGKLNTVAVNMDTASFKQMVQSFSMRTAQAESASISSTQLIVKESDTKSTTYSLPKDEFFVSIAPYVEKTHPCATHSLTGCQGEMVGEDFNISVKDSDGHMVMDNQTVQSQPNGFIDLWLPRDRTFQVTIEHDGKKAESEISTFETNDTCVTTMQLG